MNPRPLLLLVLAVTGLGAASNASADQPTRFQFREPRSKAYILEGQRPLREPGRGDWIKARPENDPENPVEIGSRLVIQISDANQLDAVLAGTSLEVARQLSPDTFVLQASNPIEAMRQAERLSQLENVTAAVPVMRRSLKRQAAVAPLPNDPAFPQQWNLEQRDSGGDPVGVDLNIRSAWVQSTGSGVTIGIGDDGVELTHEDLASRAASALHYNFGNDTTNGAASSNSDVHATAVAGLAVAARNNGLGGVGVAPDAKFASWKIFTGSTVIADDVSLGDMYQFANSSVAVQNHSWGHNSATLNEPSLPEKLALENALASGRGGKGTVFVRSIPDRRSSLGNANDDSYTSHPGVIAVAGVLSSGRVASYSDPGASILVSAPAGEFSFDTLFTTDRTGVNGYNTAASPSGDYSKTNGQGQAGTSFAAPQIAGLAALMLSVNSNLTCRDVQQILVHSARHVDFSDADLMTNGAGFVVSHNIGYGVPDAAKAVKLARSWINRPAKTTIEVPMDQESSVTAMDDGLRVLIPGAPNGLDSIAASPNLGKHPDDPTALLPLVDVGFGTNITENLIGKAALIERGGGTFQTKINNAAQAGAEFAVIFNNTGTTSRQIMTGTEYTPIPAVFISKNDGDALRAHLQTNSSSAQVKAFGTNVTFTVSDSLLCEHVAVSVEVTSRRSDVRLMLTSPSGTKSVLQTVNTDSNAVGLVVWTYASTHHFYENSAGTWTLSVYDEAPGQTTTLQTATLKIGGVPITDSDRDGLDDNWENIYFAGLSQGATDDLDGDGISNIREQIIGTSPMHYDGDLPGSLAGLSLTLTVTNGAGAFTNAGSFLLAAAPTGTAYRLFALPDTNASSGTYSYTPSVTSGTLDLGFGIYTLTFTAGGTGYFVATNVSNDMQSGTFTLLENGPDFNGDLRTDLIFQHNNGVIATWYMNGSVFMSTGLFRNGAPAGLGWRMIGTGDLNNDGQSDLIFQHTNGKLAAWYMNGTAFITSQVLRGGVAAAPGWQAVGTGDINGDRQTDILFQHDNGKLAVWYFSGTNFTGVSLLRNGQPIGAGWRTVGVGDFNGDANDDILFQHDNGKLAVWNMERQNLINSEVLRNGQAAGVGWRARAIADLNGDGKNDVIFQYTNGTMAVWYMNGKTFMSASLLRNGQPLVGGWLLAAPK